MLEQAPWIERAIDFSSQASGVGVTRQSQISYCFYYANDRRMKPAMCGESERPQPCGELK
jgi:hypothetical protein